MYCPSCRTEFREEFTICSDCQTALRPGLPPAEDQKDVEFVTILESSDRLLIAMAKGLLEEAGVFFYVCGDEIGLRPGMSDALIHRGYTIVVPQDSEARAREALELLSARRDEPA